MEIQEKKEKNQPTNNPPTTVISSMFRGPLPPPEVLAAYEKISPGAADRIIKMAKNQSSHRQKLEKSVIASNIVNEEKGIKYSFALTTLLMVIGAILIALEKSKIGAYLAIFAPSIFQADNYIYNKYIEKREFSQKDKELDTPI